MLKNIDLNLKVILLLIVLAAASRLLPHEPNFVPIAAIALFAGTFVQNKRMALVIGISALLFSDILLEIFKGNGFHSTMPFVYLSVALIGMLGFLLRGREQRQTIMVASLTGSILFFIITNFGVWVADNIYAKTYDGLVQCYVAAIPFFRGTVLGDLFYNLLLFGSYAILRWRVPALRGN